MEPITSRSNQIVARFRRVARQTAPTEPTVLLEGPRLIEEALAAGVRLELTAISTSLASGHPSTGLIDRLTPVTQIVPVSPNVMDALSPVSHPSGLVALATLPPAQLDDMGCSPRPLVVALYGVQDPGNIGAVIRTVEAGGASGVITVGGADPYSWKALRGSMGSTFRIPVTRALSPEVIGREATTRGWKVIAAVPKGGTWLAETNLGEPCLLWLGSEGKGLDRNIISAADTVLSIPMRKPVESLNIAVTAALIIYEAARQRGNFNPETVDRTRHRSRLA